MMSGTLTCLVTSELMLSLIFSNSPFSIVWISDVTLRGSLIMPEICLKPASIPVHNHLPPTLISHGESSQIQVHVLYLIHSVHYMQKTTENKLSISVFWLVRDDVCQLYPHRLGPIKTQIWKVMLLLIYAMKLLYPSIQWKHPFCKSNTCLCG